MSHLHHRAGILKGWLMAKDAPQTILDIFNDISDPVLAADRANDGIRTANKEFNSPDGGQAESLPAKEKKPRKPYTVSPERKEQLREQLAKARAARKPVVNPKFSLEDELTADHIADPSKKVAPPAAPRKDTPVERLIDTHTGYIGQRDDGLLRQEDWGDVQKMRYSGMPDEKISQKYGVELYQLKAFAIQMEKREEQKAGNS